MACGPGHPAPATSPAPAAAAPTAAARLPNDLQWTRGSAEHRAIYLQTYRLAGERLEQLVKEAGAASWGVILDADETVVDNSLFQVELFRDGATYSEERWNAWVRRREAPALPGAAAFTARVRELGGKVVIVTNRDQAVCGDTRANLDAAGITTDLVLCKQPGQSDKNPRFDAVAAGTPPSTLPPLTVLMWIGDNIQDFPGTTQAIRELPDSAFERFGRAWIVLPNPMYGSWERR